MPRWPASAFSRASRSPSHPPRQRLPPHGENLSRYARRTPLLQICLKDPYGLPLLTSESALRQSITTSLWVSSSQRSRKICSTSGLSEALGALSPLLTLFAQYLGVKTSYRGRRLHRTKGPPARSKSGAEEATFLCSFHLKGLFESLLLLPWGKKPLCPHESCT
jgi:hypothetical protein